MKSYTAIALASFAALAAAQQDLDALRQTMMDEQEEENDASDAVIAELIARVQALEATQQTLTTDLALLNSEQVIEEHYFSNKDA